MHTHLLSLNLNKTLRDFFYILNQRCCSLVIKWQQMLSFRNNSRRLYPPSEQSLRRSIMYLTKIANATTNSRTLAGTIRLYEYNDYSWSRAVCQSYRSLDSEIFLSLSLFVWACVADTRCCDRDDWTTTVPVTLSPSPLSFPRTSIFNHSLSFSHSFFFFQRTDRRAVLSR